MTRVSCIDHGVYAEEAIKHSPLRRLELYAKSTIASGNH